MCDIQILSKNFNPRWKEIVFRLIKTFWIDFDVQIEIVRISLFFYPGYDFNTQHDSTNASGPMMWKML